MNKLAIVLVLAVAISGVALADTEGPRQPASNDSFSALDRNADHRVSRSEAGFDRTLSMIFADIDTDGDGFITLLEYAAAEQSHSMASKR